LIYQAAATQFVCDFKVDVLQIMDLFEVKNKIRMLAKLNVIYACARENQDRVGGSG